MIIFKMEEKMKNRITKSLCFLLTLFIASYSLYALQKIEITEEVKENIKQRIGNGESVGIVVGIIDSHGRREFFSYGKTRMNGNIPVDENSIYEIGSISKVFTCIAFAYMVINREFNLDDPVGICRPLQEQELCVHQRMI